ncbi:hypothetical protein LguiB_019052 [Lonicera macranthoides]
METPLSTRRITRSQAISMKFEESEKGVSKSRQRIGNQQALTDITNDSPIVGLAMGNLGTPSSTMTKRRNNFIHGKQSSTPGSGEALLRDQVKNLLQKVEEESNSPMGILVTSPVNGRNNGLDFGTLSSIEEQFKISQIVDDLFEGHNKQECSVESKKSIITRSLLLDFYEKTEDSDSSECNSVLTYQLKSGKSREDDDIDDASIWSIQANASTRDDEDDNEELCIEEIEEDGEIDNDYEDDEYDDGGEVNELCEGIRKISVNGVKYCGKHIRFLYNSDDELQEEEEEEEEEEDFSSGVLRLKGLPTPKGKHLRFPEEEEEEEEAFA